MVMNEFLQWVFEWGLDWAPALAVGILLGIFFFAGLWWTVRKFELVKHAGLLFLGSMLLRTTIVISGFYFFLGDNWQHLLAGLLGFFIARIIVTRLTGFTDQSASEIEETGHAS